MVMAQIWESAMWWSACRRCVAVAFVLCLAPLIALSPAFAQVAYEYDPLGRLTKVTRDDGSITEYEYDAGDNRVEVLAVIPNEPAFSIDDVSISEGGALSFTVIKIGPSSLTHAVDYVTANGTGGAGDYTAASGALTFTSGEDTKTVAVATTSDSIFEVDETVLVKLSSPTNGAIIGDGQGTGAITNDDSAPAFSVNNVSIAEGGNLVFTVTKVGTTSQSHAVNYATANGTAGASDYTATSGVLTFAPGQASKTVTVTTAQDSVYELGETVYLNLSAATAGAVISDSQGVGTITNNDSGPAFSVNNVSVSEGGVLSFTVTKTGATSLSHAVSYATANGTASSGDYTARSGSLTFTSGQTTKAVAVSTVEDTNNEPNETLYLNLSGATNGATISDSQGRGIIQNDDEAPNSPPVAANDGANGSGQIIPGDPPLILYVLANDTDADQDPLTVIAVTQPSVGSAQIGGGGAYIIYTPPSFGGGTAHFFYTVSDGAGGTDTAAVWGYVEIPGTE